MPIPDFQTLMLPLLRLLADGEEHTPAECVERLAEEFALSEKERAEQLPSGSETVIANRIAWARTHMGKAGLTDNPRRGVWKISDRGQALLAENPKRVDLRLLRQFPEYVAFREKKNQGKPSESRGAKVAHETSTVDEDARETPEDLMRAGWEEHRAALEDELLAAVKRAPPRFFERLVVDLLLSMGYGGSRTEAASAIGRSGDEGIDGFIKEDRLGLDVVYVQAKRWDTRTVGRPEIQQFVGALHGQRARKGVFITTSTFSKDGVRYVDQIESKVVLIDGATLARMMADFGVGVATIDTYEIKRLNSDYFETA